MNYLVFKRLKENGAPRCHFAKKEKENVIGLIWLNCWTPSAFLHLEMKLECNASDLWLMKLCLDFPLQFCATGDDLAFFFSFTNAFAPCEFLSTCYGTASRLGLGLVRILHRAAVEEHRASSTLTSPVRTVT